MKSCEKIIKIELRRSFDPTSNAAAGSVKTPERNQWQRARVTGLIRRIKTEADAIRPGLWISAAVWPYYLDKRGWRLSEGYNDYYQDSKGWLVTGVIEAIAPMFIAVYPMTLSVGAFCWRIFWPIVMAKPSIQALGTITTILK